MTAPSSAPPAVRRTQRLVLTTLCSALFLAMLDNVVVSNALPRIAGDLDAGLRGLQWVLEGYSLVYAALLLAGGTLGDRFGRRRFFLTGVALFTLGSAICSLAGSIPVLITGRVVQAVGAAAYSPQSLAILRTTFTDPDQQGRAIGTWSGMSALGLAAGPAIGGPLIDTFGWPSAFWINLPIGAAALILAYLVIPPTPGTQRRTSSRFDLPGQITGGLGLAALVFALIEGPNQGWTSWQVLTGAMTAMVCVAVFVPLELRTTDPMVDLRLFSDRILAGAALTGFIMSFGVFGCLSYLGLFLQNVLGWSPAGAGFASLPSTCMIMIAAPIASRLTLRFGPRPPLVTGMILCTIGIGGLSRYGLGASYTDYWWTLPLFGLGMGMSFSPIAITMMRRVPVSRAGMASAIVNTSRQVGGVAGIAVLGAILSARIRCVLPDHLLAAHLPPAQADAVTDTVASGGSGGISRPAGLPTAVVHAVAWAFTDGLHLALLTASGVLLMGAVVVAALLAPGLRQQRLPLPADGPHQDSSEKSGAPSR